MEATEFGMAQVFNMIVILSMELNIPPEELTKRLKDIRKNPDVNEYIKAMTEAI